MASDFESMKKLDLVKEARSLTQQVKLLEQQVKELQTDISNKTSEVGDTPLVAISMMFNKATGRTEIHTVNFNLETGQAVVNADDKFRKDFKQDYKAFAFFEQVRMKYVDSQVINIPRKEEVQNEE